MNILGIVKPVTTVIASLGVGAVIGNVIRTTTPVGIGPVSKVAVGVGTLVLTTVLGDLAAKSVHDTIDKSVESIDEIKSVIETAQQKTDA